MGASPVRLRVAANRQLFPVIPPTTINFRADQEWHSPAYAYRQGQTIELVTFGNVKHYAGVFDVATFAQRLQQAARQQNRFPFMFGTDRFRQRIVFTARNSGHLRVVIRVGVFNPGGGAVTVALNIG